MDYRPEIVHNRVVIQDLKTLVVEDDRSLREVLRQYLSVYHEVSAAPDLATARKLLADKDFDLILLDKQLPDGSGLDLLADVNRLRPGAAVVILTSDGEFDSITKALAQGADDYVVKSEHLIPHLLVRFPVAVRHAKERLRMKALQERSNARIPESREQFNAESYQACLNEVERDYLKSALQAFDGNVPLTAEKLGISRSTLFRKISELGLAKKDNSEDASLSREGSEAV